MIIIETCPKCGHDLIDTVIDTYPPIPRKDCPACGWFWVGRSNEQIARIPFGGNSTAIDNLTTDTITAINSIGLPDPCTADDIECVCQIVNKR